jgi:hypothetical protein
MYTVGRCRREGGQPQCRVGRCHGIEDLFAVQVGEGDERTSVQAGQLQLPVPPGQLARYGGSSMIWSWPKSFNSVRAVVQRSRG